MSLIDITYFVSDLNIPISSTEALNGQLVNYISKYEPEALKLLLGYPLYKELAAAVTAYEQAKEDYDNDMLTYDPETDEPLVEPVLESRFDKLVNGSEFSFQLEGETITEYWPGLKNTDNVSLIANYVYFHYRRDNVSQFNGLSETVSYSESSRSINPREKLVKAWNGFVDQMGEGCLSAYTSGNSSYTHTDSYPSAYNFLLANLSDYPNWKFTPQQTINSWGL